MRTQTQGQSQTHDERGMVLMLALMVLITISAVAAAIIFMSGGESTQVGDQRNSTRALYASEAGLEEARARLIPYHPNALTSLPTAVGQVVYIVNPNATQVQPNVATNQYFDSEYQQEFGSSVTTATVTTVTTSQPVLSGFTAIPYNWVRITVKTERAANADINGDSTIDNAIPVFYDGQNENLANKGDRIYRLASRTVLSGLASPMLEMDIVPLSGPGWNYAIAAGNAITGLPAGTIQGPVFSNKEIVINNALSILGGDVQSAAAVTGSGAITLNGSYQAKANNAVDNTVTGGGSPNKVVGAGTVTVQSSPSTPTPAPLAPNTIPNPDWNNISPKVTDTVLGNPPACSGPGSVNGFGGCTWNLGSGKVINFPAAQSFGPNDRFAGTGTIAFSGGQSVDFNNPMGTSTAPLQINIIARPSDNTVGFDTMTFKADVYINGLIYSHGEVYHHPGCPPTAAFVVNGAVITYNYNPAGGPIPNGDFEAPCSTPFQVKLDPAQFSTNPPPGFAGLLTGAPGSGGTKVLSWRQVF